MKLSRESPNTEPRAFATPITSNGRPSMLICLPTASTFGNSFSLRSLPMKTTERRRSSSFLDMNLPLTVWILEITPMLGVAPMH